jgi:protein-disulfide isomerase
MFYGVLGVIAIAGLVAIGVAMFGGPGGTAATDLVELNVESTRELYDQATPIRLGQEDAPVKIVEFADFQCPGCGAFSLQVRPRVMPYIDSGLAQLIYYDYPLGGSHVHSFLAARSARCAAEQPDPATGTGSAYWTYHDKLYAEQVSWSRERDVVDEFIDYGQQVGLDADELASCIRSDKYADVVTANRVLGEQLGVAATPTVLVNNQRVGGRSIQDMGDNLVQLIEEARAQQESSTEAESGE